MTVVPFKEIQKFAVGPDMFEDKCNRSAGAMLRQISIKPPYGEFE